MFLLADVTSELPGFDGFLGTRASLMMDVVALALVAILPILAYSIYLVKYRQKFELHKKIQVTLGLILLVAVALFELDIQLLSRWEERAAGSPYFSIDNKFGDWVGISLIVHLLFAVPTAVLWIVVIVRALRNFPSPVVPGAHSQSHKFWGWAAALGMLGTAVTGWFFYYLGFAI
ncbi:MAG: putative membrane protein [Pirellulaceae bacterium]